MEANGLISTASFGLLITALVLILFGAFKGMRRGIIRQSVRFGTIVLSLIAAYISAQTVTSTIVDFCSNGTIADLVNQIGANSDGSLDAYMGLLASFDAETAQYLLLLPATTVLAPIAFVLVFLATSALLYVVYVVLTFVVRIFGRRKGMVPRLVGAAIGAVQGVIVVIVLFTPIVGIVDLGAEVATTYVEAMDKEEEGTPEEASADEGNEGAYDDNYMATGQESVDYRLLADELNSFNSSPAMAVFGGLGARGLYNSFTRVSVDGEVIDFGGVFSEVANVFFEAGELEGFRWDAVTEHDREILHSIVDKVDDSRYTKLILSGFLRGFARASESGELELVADEPYIGVIRELIHVFTDSNEDNIARDLDTVVDVYVILSEEGFFTSAYIEEGSLRDVLISTDENGEMVIQRVMNILDSNPHTRPVKDALARVTVTIIQNSMDFGEGSEELYENMKTGLTDTLSIDKTEYETEEEYVAAVEDSIAGVFEENGIEADEEIIATMAQHVNEQDLSGQEITDAQINDLILSYYDGYVASMNSANP
ncbi:MAG: CvpA family protein [Clostridia bacterium]|nr:CvpA family protein [Clostridia bacterium]MBQ8720118.1 CvpA family protein [Clostridia bacterium]